MVSPKIWYFDHFCSGFCLEICHIGSNFRISPMWNYRCIFRVLEMSTIFLKKKVSRISYVIENCLHRSSDIQYIHNFSHVFLWVLKNNTNTLTIKNFLAIIDVSGIFFSILNRDYFASRKYFLPFENEVSENGFLFLMGEGYRRSASQA